MTDPAAMEGMMGMMKGNMAMMIPQTVIMGWINAFFAGFVISMSPNTPSQFDYHYLIWCWAQADGGIVKLPFPLTIRFKSMLQSGVAMSDLTCDGYPVCRGIS